MKLAFFWLFWQRSTSKMLLISNCTFTIFAYALVFIHSLTPPTHMFHLVSSQAASELWQIKINKKQMSLKLKPRGTVADLSWDTGAGGLKTVAACLIGSRYRWGPGLLQSMERYGEIRCSHFLSLSGPLLTPSAFAIPRARVHTVAEARAAWEHLIAWAWSHSNFPEGQNGASARGEGECDWRWECVARVWCLVMWAGDQASA